MEYGVWSMEEGQDGDRRHDTSSPACSRKEKLGHFHTYNIQHTTYNMIALENRLMSLPAEGLPIRYLLSSMADGSWGMVEKSI
jgi:hypothetical protein